MMPATCADDFLARCHRVLEGSFGFASFRDGQLQALEALSRGRDCLVIMPTGSGKSLCYQVPALALPGATLVVSPLIALMKDQVDQLALRGIPATCVNSSISFDEQWARLEAVRAGAVKLLYVAPERFRSRTFQHALGATDISLLAIDEAHCISQWGHDFRPDYRRLKEVRARLEGVPVLALTATATPAVQEDIARELLMEDPVRIVTGFDRPNLHLEVRKARSDAEKLDGLREIVEELGRRHGPHLSGIVYTGTRRQAEEVAAFLDEIPRTSGPENGSRCRPYHAGLADFERREVQEDFMAGRLPCVAATNAFGMGVDKADIRFVLHYTLPGSIESYYQEIGRAGRDGLPADCVLFFSESDRRLQEFFIQGGNPSRRAVEGVHAFLWTLGENPIFRTASELEVLLAGSPAVPERLSTMAIRSTLTILERSGAIQRLDHYDNLAEVRPTRPWPWEANPFPPRASVRHVLWEALRRVFTRTEGEAASIALEQWSQAVGLPGESVRRGLHQLDEDGWIRYLPPFRGRAVQLPEKRADLAEVVDFEALRRKRERDEERLQQMLAFARSRACRRDSILRHFGEEVPGGGCGACDSCRRHGGSHGGATHARPLDEEELTTVRKILSGVARARGRVGRGRIVQMLLGSRAQPVLESGLDQLSTYGILKGMERRAMLEIMDELESAGCLRQVGDRFPVLRITERGWRVMKGEERVLLAYPALQPERGRGEAELTEDEEELFERLRRLRRSLARKLELPAYRVFSDRTLKAVARRRPATEEALRTVPGVGAATLERFGKHVLREVRRFGDKR